MAKEKQRSFLGLDFGTDSVRAIVADETGQTLAEAVRPYPRWSEGRFIQASASLFRQHPHQIGHQLHLDGFPQNRTLRIGGPGFIYAGIDDLHDIDLFSVCNNGIP